MQVTGNNLNQNKSLSIRLSTGGFSFCAYSSGGTEKGFNFVPYKVNPDVSMAANLKTALNAEALFLDSYQSIQVLIDGASCRVPLEGFEESDKETVFMYNFPHERGKVVLSNYLSQSNIVILTSIDRSVYQLLLDYCPTAHFYASETPVLEHFISISKLRETQKLYAVFYYHRLYTYVMNDGKLTFANCFSVLHDNDSLYYLLQIWKSQGLNQTIDEMHLVGNISQLETLISELRRFIKHVYTLNPEVEFLGSENRFPKISYDLLALISGAL